MKKDKKKKNNTKKSILIIIISLLIIAYGVLALNLIKVIPFLPLKFSLVVMIVIGIFLILNIFIIIKILKKKKRIYKLLGIILIIIYLFINQYLHTTFSFLGSIKSKDFKLVNYYVMVLKDSKYDKIKDIKNKDVYYSTSFEEVDKALEELNNKVKINSKEEEYSNELVDKLLSKDVEIILIPETYKQILDEESKDFDSKTKIIYTLKILVDSKTKSKQVNVEKTGFNIYLTGIDTYGDINSTSRSDVNIIATVNPKTKTILLTSIPRDYYVKLNGFNVYDKLTHAGMYGVETSIGTLEDLLNIDINYYIKVNFTSVIKSIDALGGINVDSKYSFRADKYKFVKGINYMTGDQALEFSRERKSFTEGDRVRGENQQAVIIGMLEKMMSPAILTKYNSLLNSLDGSFQTNFSTSEIQKLIKNQLSKMEKWNIKTISLNGSDSSNYTYSFGKQKLYVMEPDKATVKTASKIIKQVLTGEEFDINEMPKTVSNVVSKSSTNSTPVTTVDKKEPVKNSVETTPTVEDKDKDEDDDKDKAVDEDEDVDEDKDIEDEPDKKENGIGSGEDNEDDGLIEE